MKKDHRFGGYGKQLENLVYLSLTRSGHTVSTVRTGKGEVDFVSEKNADRAYYQVAWTINDPGSDTYRREFDSLLSIPDHCPKQIITMDDLPLPPQKGIRHLTALDFFPQIPAEQKGFQRITQKC
jgi:predicted AAA+ superfamily ATPase